MLDERIHIDLLEVGEEFITTFSENPVTASRFRFRATHLDSIRAPKIILCNDPRIVPGVPCRVLIRRIRKPLRPDRGSIEVEFVQREKIELDGIYVDPQTAIKLQVLLEAKKNVLLDGPQGCGKTVLTKAIAEQLGLDFTFFNCAAVVDPNDFVATLQVCATATGQPVTEFIATELLKTLLKAAKNPSRSYLIFLDEFNRCPENARNILMPALDSTRTVFNPIENRFIPVPDNVQFIAAVNRGKQFTATFGIDIAQLDRFAPLHVDYLPAAEEIQLLKRRHSDVPRSVIEELVTCANRVRHSEHLASGLSVRATEEACLYLKHPLMRANPKKHLQHVLRTSFCGRFAGRADDPMTEAGIVWDIIRSVTS
jgi:nitric oxide reductase NorQ protein